MWGPAERPCAQSRPKRTGLTWRLLCHSPARLVRRAHAQEQTELVFTQRLAQALARTGTAGREPNGRLEVVGHQHDDRVGAHLVDGAHNFDTAAPREGVADEDE